jgi:integrase
MIEQNEQPKDATKREPKTRRTVQILRRGENRFMVRIYLGTDPITGKRNYHNHTVRGTKTDAEKYQTAKLRELDLGAFVEPTKKTLGGYFDEWLIGKRMEVTARTADGYAGLFERRLRKPLGKTRLTMLQTADIQQVYVRMMKDGLSARSVKHLHVVLNAVLNDAVSAKHLPLNPADLVKLPKIEKKEQRFFKEEAARFLEACATMPRGLIFEFAVMAGMRPQEYLALQWRDVDFERNTVTVMRALEQHKGEWRFKETKTALSRRRLPIPAPLIEKLRRHKREQNEHRLKIGLEWQQHDLVFCSEIGTPLNYAGLTYRYFRPILEKAGLAHATMYALRHSHATLLLVMEQNPKIVSERLGHSSIRLTMDTYSHVVPTMQRGASDKLEGLLYGQSETASLR